jgi:hypothetical protein
MSAFRGTGQFIVGGAPGGYAKPGDRSTADSRRKKAIDQLSGSGIAFGEREVQALATPAGAGGARPMKPTGMARELVGTPGTPEEKATMATNEIIDEERKRPRSRASTIFAGAFGGKGLGAPSISRRVLLGS